MCGMFWNESNENKILKKSLDIINNIKKPYFWRISLNIYLHDIKCNFF